MRLGCVLLVALAAFFTACDAVTTSNQVKLTPTTIDRGLGDRRLLRSNGANIDAADDEGEERAWLIDMVRNFLARNDFDMTKLSKMMDNEAYKLKMFKKWDSHKHSIGNIQENMNLRKNPHFDKLLLDYLNKYQRKATKVEKVKRGNKVRPAGNRVTINDVPSVREF
uniref:RxLR effector protein n=2 Tax=Phytophthora sojae TaxID=67593 RepID=G1FR20_PHYSO|nr:Avh45 [Phytophthora sojae]AEK80559.1 Avh45 [Phytophthora sojae]